MLYQPFLKQIVKLLALSFILLPGLAHAGKVINELWLWDDGYIYSFPHNVEVGDTIWLGLYVSHDGSGNSNSKKWRATSYTIDGVKVCVNHDNYDPAYWDWEWVEVTVPNSAGVQNIAVVGHTRNDCASRSHDTAASSVSINIQVDSPTDISLSNSTLTGTPSIGDLVGNLSTTGGNPNYTYTLTNNCSVGDNADNGSFSINSSQLNVAEANLTPGTYEICITTTDSNSQNYSEHFHITNTNSSPTNISISNNTLVHNVTGNGVTVGTLSATDPDDSSHTFSVADALTYANCDENNNQNSSFQINGSNLQTASVLTAGSYNVCVEANDGANSYAKDITISITNSAPTNISISNSTLVHNVTGTGATVGTLSATDSDDSSHTFSIFNPASSANCDENDNNNSSFQVSSTTLQTASSLTAGSYNVCIEASDGSDTYVKDIAITITNSAPTDIAIDDDNIPANATGSGALVGNLSATDSDDSSHTFTIVAPNTEANCSNSGNDNSSFQISGTQLQTSGALSADSYTVCVQASDGFNTYAKDLTVTVTSSGSGGGTCDDVFLNGVASNSSDGKLTMNSNSKIYYSTTTQLAFAQQGNIGSESCVINEGEDDDDAQQCQTTGSSAASFDLPTFPTNSYNTSTTFNSNVVLGEGSYNTDTFGNINVNDGTLSFSSNYSTYYIGDLNLNNDALVKFKPGTYYIDQLQMNSDSDIEVEGNGTVNIYVKENIHVNSNSEIKGNIGNAKLVLITYKDLHVNSNGEVEAMVYVNRTTHVDSNGIIRGGLSTGDLNMNSNAKIYFNDDFFNSVDFGTICGGALDITLAPTTVMQSSTGTNVNISTITSDNTTSPVYALINASTNSDTGSCSASEDDHNSLFNISGDKLRTNSTVSNGTYNICLQVTDAGVTYEEAFVISVVGPIAWYSFEDPNWLADNTGNGNTASAVGSATSVLPTSPFSEKSCRAVNIPYNYYSSTKDAIDTGLDLDSEIGSKGTIEFWYSSAYSWQYGFSRQLLDASTTVNNRYFFAVLRGDGRIRFGVEDTSDDDRVMETDAYNFGANTWVHLAFTWDYDNNDLKIFVNGAEANATAIANDTINNITGFDTLYIGDNRSSYLVNGATANSATGLIDEVYVYNFQLSATQIQTDMNNTNDCAVANIHHYEIVHDGVGLTCQDESVEIRACNNVDCSDKYAGQVDFSFTSPTGYWGGDNKSFTGGTGTFSLDYNQQGNVTVAIGNLSPAADNATECTPAGCQIAFSNKGFVVGQGSGNTYSDIPNHVAETSESIVISAVQDDGSGNSCIAAYQGQTLELGLKQQCIDNPSTCNGTSFSLVTPNQGTIALPTNSFQNVTGISFNSDGRATLSGSYADVGNIQLDVKYDPTPLDSNNGDDIYGFSNEFDVYPDNIELVVLTQKTGGSAIDNDGDSNGPTYMAGNEFYFKISARGSAGSILPSYTPGDLELKVTRTGPNSGTNEGAFTYNTGSSITSSLSASFTNAPALVFNDGVFEFESATYSEVGSIELDVKDAAFAIGSNTYEISSAGSIDVGRFIPAYFSISDSDMDIGSFDGGFTYAGQELIFLDDEGSLDGIDGSFTSLKPYNANGQVTNNYDIGNYFKMPTVSASIYDCRYYSNNVSGQTMTSSVDYLNFNTSTNLCGASLNSNDALFIIATESSSAGEGNGNGLFTYSMSTSTQASHDSITYTKGTTAYAPFTPNFTFHVPAGELTDSDEVGYDSSPDIGGSSFDDRPFSINVTSGTEIRYARLVLEDNFGPETEAMPINFYIEYWDGSKWVVNADDEESTYGSGDLNIDDAGGLTVSKTVVASGTKVVAGAADPNNMLGITAPGSGNTGAVQISLTVPEWLKYDWDGDGDLDNPTAEITFGVFRGNDKIIYWQEN